jgi:hypothetical protein
LACINLIIKTLKSACDYHAIASVECYPGNNNRKKVLLSSTGRVPREQQAAIAEKMITKNNSWVISVNLPGESTFLARLS